PGDRVGRARMIELAEEGTRQVNEQLNNWVVIGVPNAGWANQMFGEPDLERTLDELKIDALRYRGPGTDLTVGLLPESRWQGCESFTAEGLRYVANMPTEEVFTTPDARRTEGVVRSTMPLVVYGRIVRGLEVRFEGGRIVDVQADEGADVIRGQLGSDERAAYLGEVALVDGTSRIGQTGLTFFETLYDENARCHIAYGSAYAEAVEGGLIDGVNVSPIHTDFMIGGPDVDVDAVLRDGTIVSFIRDDRWLVG